MVERVRPSCIYDIVVKDLNGNDVNMSSYKGKVLLIVNVASKCGLLAHSHYKHMNDLYERYRDQGFEILAFPCNQFLGHEPGDIQEIKEAYSWFEAEFAVFDKIDVNGKHSSPLFKFLKHQKGGILGNFIKCNFTKFLVSRDGTVTERYVPITTSFQKIEEAIQKLLLEEED